MTVENKKGRFGKFGGQYVPEIVMPVLNQLEEAYEKYRQDPDFLADLRKYYVEYAGRPTLLYYADKLTKHYGGAKIYLKREDLLHTGAHKINNALGQALLALFGMKCKVFMGAVDIERQKLNVFRMKLLGAEVVPVTTGTGTLKDATSEAIRYWAAHIDDTHYIIGSAVGPHPYPTMVRDFQSVIGQEIRQQIQQETGGRLDYMIACVGGGSNAIGTFYEFKDDAQIKKFGVEAAGRGPAIGDNAQTLSNPDSRPGVLHGAYSYLAQDEDGQVIEVYSISAGLDYPGVGPEHSMFHEQGVVEYVGINDKEALDAFQLLCRTEGIIPAVESSHALAYLEKLMPSTKPEEVVVVTLSGRGDKDVQQVAKVLGEEI